MSYPAQLGDDRDRPSHGRLTSSAYLLGSQHARRGSDVSYHSSLGLGRPGAEGDAGAKSLADASDGIAGGPNGGTEGEAMVGQEAMRLGTSFFMFGMLIGERVLVRLVHLEAKNRTAT